MTKVEQHFPELEQVLERTVIGEVTLEVSTKCGGPVRLCELADKPLLLPGKDNGLRRVVDESCRMNGVELRWLAEIDCMDAAKQLVTAGHWRCLPV